MLRQLRKFFAQGLHRNDTAIMILFP
jgi:hypothetical protein